MAKCSNYLTVKMVTAKFFFINLLNVLTNGDMETVLDGTRAFAYFGFDGESIAFLSKAIEPLRDKVVRIDSAAEFLVVIWHTAG